MAIIDTLRFCNILVDRKIAEEAAAQELVAALDETLEDFAGNLATKQDLLLLRAEVAQIRAELLAEIRALEARMYRFIVVVAGVQLTALGIAVGLILALN